MSNVILRGRHFLFCAIDCHTDNAFDHAMVLKQHDQQSSYFLQDIVNMKLSPILLCK